MNVILPRRLNVDEFLRWLEAQAQGHYELERGRIIVMHAENLGHAKIKHRIVKAVENSIERSGVAFYAAPDGPRVRVRDDRSYEPDALIGPLPEPPEDQIEIPNPVAVFEVLSPTPKSVRRDLTEKLVGYSLVSSIQHYVVIDPEERVALHYHRQGDQLILTGDPIEGTLHLGAVGIQLSVADFFGPQPKSVNEN